MDGGASGLCIRRPNAPPLIGRRSIPFWIVLGRAALAAVIAAVITASGAVLATTPSPPGDDLEEAAEAAFEQWLYAQGAAVNVPTVACGVDSVSSLSVYCYAHTDTGIVSGVAPIPPPGGTFAFTLNLGSIGGAGVPVPTSWPAGPAATVITTMPPAIVPPPKTDPAPTVAPGGASMPFGEGLYLVNAQILPGRYRADGSEFCYWERLAAPDEALESVIANAIVTGGQAVVDIVATDVAFSSSGCGQWLPYTPPAAMLTSFGPGVYVVGADIAPGTYAADGGSDCFWRRLAGFSGDFDELIEIENMTGPGNVVVEASDVGFESAQCGTWTPVRPASGDAQSG
jgi:hypothetical protein